MLSFITVSALFGALFLIACDFAAAWLRYRRWNGELLHQLHERDQRIKELTEECIALARTTTHAEFKAAITPEPPDEPPAPPEPDPLTVTLEDGTKTRIIDIMGTEDTP